MGYIVRMPKLGVEMQTGILLEWYVEPGDRVTEADLLAEIESEKTTAEVTARESGTLEHALLEPGAEVEPGTPMAIVSDGDDVSELLAEVEAEGESIGETGGDGAETPADEPTSSEGATADERVDNSGRTATDDGEPGDASSVRATPKARKRALEVDVDLATISGTGPNESVKEADVEQAISGSEPAVRAEATGSVDSPQTGSGAPTSGRTTPSPSPERRDGDLLATPRARKRAAELEVALETVPGTGPHGSVRAEDVESAAERGQATGQPGTPATSAGGRTVLEERPLSGMRSTISRRLSESWEAPHVTVDRRVDIEAALEAADEAADIVSITDVLFRAVSETLAEHPQFNATFEDDVHRLYHEHNVGFAVDVDSGLLTPVLENVEAMSLPELAHQRGALTERVLDGRHEVSDLQGGTFTISNLGVLGIDSFTPIINPPQVAILGVNRIREEPQRTDRGLEFRRTMGFSLSFDHRVIDGADAARFLATLADRLQRSADRAEAEQ